MPPSLSDDQLASVAVFPLPNAVLFPGARMPLHIFEPRYRAMMADVLAGGSGLMVVAQLKPGWQQDYGGQPPMSSTAGIGRIERSRLNPDGTYDLELHGLTRVKLHELPMLDKPYRRARATGLSDLAPPGWAPESELMSLFSLASQVVAIVRKREPRFRLLATLDDEPALLIDKVADQLVGDPIERQRLLELLDLGDRLEVATSLVAQLQLTLADDDGGAVLH